MRPSRVRNLACATTLLMCGAANAQAFRSSAQSYDAKVMAQDILKQSGLRLPAGVSDLVEFAALQGAQADCVSINVDWTSLPESTKFAREDDADGPGFVETLEIRSRHALPACDPKTYRASPALFPFFGLAVFGISSDGVIRGLHLEPDPRVVIFDCFATPEASSDASRNCGRWVQQKSTVDIRMPRDPQITRLAFYVRKQDSPPGQWHIVQVGSIEQRSFAVPLDPKNPTRGWRPESKGVAMSLWLDSVIYTMGPDIPVHLAVESFSADADVISGEIPCSAGFKFELRNAAGQLAAPVGEGICVGDHGGYARYPKGVLVSAEGFTLRGLGLLPRDPGTYTLEVLWEAEVANPERSPNVAPYTVPDGQPSPFKPYAAVRSNPAIFILEAPAK